jgi:hypothetical protein
MLAVKAKKMMKKDFIFVFVSVQYEENLLNDIIFGR